MKGTGISAYIGLFFAALLAATILPMQSEAVLVGLLLSDSYSVFALIAFASVGNILGSWINWRLGRYIEHYKDRRWFPVKPSALQRAANGYRRYGRWSLLLSWVPVIAEKRTLLEILCLNLACKNASLTISMRKPFDALAEGLKMKNGTGVWN